MDIKAVDNNTFSIRVELFICLEKQKKAGKSLM